MESFVNTALTLPKAVCEEFERALRSGVWSNGMPMTPKQRQICVEALQLRDLRKTVH